MARRPKHQRKPDDFKRGTIAHWPVGKTAPAVIAARASYIPSGEHKKYPSPNGQWTIAHKADKAKCDRFAEADWPQLLTTLRQAIVASVVDQEFRGDFPARTWAYINEVLHEARLSNQETGQYHGFPLEYPEQFPEDQHNLLRLAPRVTIAVL